MKTHVSLFFNRGVWTRVLAYGMGIAGIWGCATILPGQHPNPSETTSVQTTNGTETPVALNPVSHHFSPPTALDQLLDKRPQPLPAIKPVSTSSGGVLASPSTPNANENSFCIQVDALSDMDAAQARKSELEKKLGEKIDVVFDAPYYKLRFGNFSSQQEAQNKLVDIAGKNVQGFVVRQ